MRVILWRIIIIILLVAFFGGSILTTIDHIEDRIIEYTVAWIESSDFMHKLTELVRDIAEDIVRDILSQERQDYS